eukprot:4217785-Prymnesium_polylepis.1
MAARACAGAPPSASVRARGAATRTHPAALLPPHPLSPRPLSLSLSPSLSLPLSLSRAVQPEGVRRLRSSTARLRAARADIATLGEHVTALEPAVDTS